MDNRKVSALRGDVKKLIAQMRGDSPPVEEPAAPVAEWPEQPSPELEAAVEEALELDEMAGLDVAEVGELEVAAEPLLAELETEAAAVADVADDAAFTVEVDHLADVSEPHDAVFAEADEADIAQVVEEIQAGVAGSHDAPEEYQVEFAEDEAVAFAEVEEAAQEAIAALADEPLAEATEDLAQVAVAVEAVEASAEPLPLEVEPETIELSSTAPEPNGQAGRHKYFAILERAAKLLNREDLLVRD